MTIWLKGFCFTLQENNRILIYELISMKNWVHIKTDEVNLAHEMQGTTENGKMLYVQICS